MVGGFAAPLELGLPARCHLYSGRVRIRSWTALSGRCGVGPWLRYHSARETQAMGRLGTHPHVVSVFDLGEHEGQPYIVTGLMGGGDVESLLEDTDDPIPLERTLEIAKGVKHGWQDAGRQGRDRDRVQSRDRRVHREASGASCASVVIAARTEEVQEKRLPGTIHSVADAIRAEGGTAFPLRTDARDPESIYACVEKTVDEFGRLDIVVNNAAVVVPGDIETVLDRHIELMWQIDLRGPVLMCKAAVPHLKTAGGGHIINLSSLAAIFPGPGPYDEPGAKGSSTAW